MDSSRRVFSFGGLSALLSAASANSSELLLTANEILSHSAWVAQVRVYPLRPREPWDEQPSGFYGSINPFGRKANGTPVRVEWTSARPVREARAKLGRALPDGMDSGHYVVATSGLSAALQPQSAFLICQRCGMVKSTGLERMLDPQRPTFFFFFPAIYRYGAGDIVFFNFDRDGLIYSQGASFNISKMVGERRDVPLL